MRAHTFIWIIVIISVFACKGRMYQQPTSSMEETMKRGEAFYVMNAEEFERDDIVVFEFWGDNYSKTDQETGKYKKEWQKWVKRLIAKSGDMLEIKNGEIFINAKHTASPPGALMEYDLFSTAMIEDLPVREEWENIMVDSKNDTFHYVVTLTAGQASAYKNRKEVVSVRKKFAVYNEMDTVLARSCSDCKWSIDNYGPIRIPLPGDTIDVTTANFTLYQNIPGIQTGKNVIREKLYFVMGDNRHRSMDSRYIGYISHSKMVGVVK